MITILVDHNMEGQAALLAGTLVTNGWLEVIPIQFVRFTDVNLAIDSNDRVVWRFVQTHQLILLTDNRSMKGDDSLEQTRARKTPPTRCQ